jgi:hypothetical protein
MATRAALEPSALDEQVQKRLELLAVKHHRLSPIFPTHFVIYVVICGYFYRILPAQANAAMESNQIIGIYRHPNSPLPINNLLKLPS